MKTSALTLVVLTAGAAARTQTAVPQKPPVAQTGKTGAEPRLHKTHENYTTPALTPTDWLKTKPIIADKGEGETFTRQLVAVQWRMGDPVYLYIVKPKGVARPPVVLYLYSYPATTERFLDNAYCARITARGCAAVGYDLALDGDRYRNRPMREWFVSELPEALTSTAHDTQLILNYLAERGDFDMSRVGMFGTGSGASVAIMAAAVNKRIKALDLIMPWGDWPTWMTISKLVPENERSAYIRSEFQQKIAALDPVKWLPRLQTIPIRMQFIEDDQITPKACQEKIAAVAPKGSKIERFADNMAQFRAVNGGKLFLWMAQQLKATSPAASVSPPKPVSISEKR